MATNTQIPLGVFRDRSAPFDPNNGKTGYYVAGTTNPSPVGRSFQSIGIKGLRNVTEDGNTYGSFIYTLTEGSVPEEILTVQASGSILLSCNT